MAGLPKALLVLVLGIADDSLGKGQGQSLSVLTFHLDLFSG